MGKRINVFDDKFQAELSKLMAEAAETPEGMRALAAAIAPPIQTRIDEREISSLLLAKSKLPAGEPAKFQKPTDVQAYWIAKNGDAVQSLVGEDEVEFTINRLHSNPMIDISTLKHGNVGTLVDMQKAAADAIRKKRDQRTLSVISAAVPVGRTVTCSGGKLTSEALGQAIALVEDQELSVKYLVMRGTRMNEMKGWGLDPVTDRELRMKGIFNAYNGAEIVNSASALSTEVLLIPDEEIGKLAFREMIRSDQIDVKTSFKTGWLIWEEVAQGITRPDLLAKVVITA